MRKFPFLLISLFALFTPCKSAFAQAPDSTNAPTNIYSGYVVYQSGDTVKCDFKKPLLGVLKFRPANSTGKFKKPTLDAVKEYYSSYDSTAYIAVSMAMDTTSTDMDMQYLKRLENGTIKLYEQDMDFPQNNMNGTLIGNGRNIYYFINKDDGLLRPIKTSLFVVNPNAPFQPPVKSVAIIPEGGSRKTRRNYLYEFLADDPALAGKFKNEKKFDIKTIRYYVSTYNADKSGISK